MRAAVALALVVLGLPEACAKLRLSPAPKEEAPAEPPPAPLVSAKPPPVWAPTAPPAAATGAPQAPRDPVLERAQAAAAAGEHKKVKAMLDKRVRTGKATGAEAAVLYGSCTALKDKACVGAVRAKYPAAVAP